MIANKQHAVYFHPTCNPQEMKAQYQKMFPSLPPWRQEKLLQYRSDKDRWLCAAAYMLTRHCLRGEGFPDLVTSDWAFGPYGKPYFAQHPKVHFSLSHCDAGVVCAFSEHRIGVDIECIRPFDSLMAKHVLTPEEVAIVLSSARPDLVFTALWTLKESWIKAVGEGLHYSMQNVSVSYDGKDFCIQKDNMIATIVTTTPQYIISVCRFHEPNITGSILKFVDIL